MKKQKNEDITGQILAAKALAQEPREIITYRKVRRWKRKFRFSPLPGKLITERIPVKWTIYPPTMGKQEYLERTFLELGIDYEKLHDSKHVEEEVMRVTAEKTGLCARLMAIATLNTEKELKDKKLIEERTELFKWNCTQNEFVTALLTVYSMVDRLSFLVLMRLMQTMQLNAPSQKETTRRIK